MTELNAEHARRAIVEHTRRLAESAAAAGPDAAVPTTPEWTITDLVEHVGQTQHWVAEIIERRITDPAQLPTEMAVLPTDPREWQAWLASPRSGSRARAPMTRSTRRCSTTAGDAGAWFLERRPDGATWQPGTQQADVSVTGPARSLLLTLTRRLPLTDREATNISVDGDTDLAQHWLDKTAHVSG
jgi:hypothetical protein